MMSLNNGLITGDDGHARCLWCGNDPLYVAYHDQEWGRPQTNDIRLFEKICLEGFQAGLSWLTILRKRENFRKAFDHFDFNKVALYDEDNVQILLKNQGIIRHEGKIRSVINNAQKTITLIEEHGSIAAFLEPFRQDLSTRPDVCSYDALKSITMTEESISLSKALKKRGFSFVGPTTMYAFMQSIGMVNDHFEGCFVRKACENLVE